ncbi:MAG: DNA-protecting protein DprA [Gammaproteobacteria bacterium]|nr:DNA-protecting protein DprA [Gammaproteobacteria bacterium]NIN62970.1 DNA-protecting protein DprA [Gammaproteobacteria bacterium]NIO63951.1 DNA-protecting protein DprA [Gammaproteobacteria bacterium]NIP50329.1 DNA-protecting protein DprA [Gammaproteobacteria bacterium]NIQ12549.1 DNA-protecting protein DprA [Gammaproteobacteria bacterium]
MESWLVLSRAPGLGAVHIRQLLELFTTPQNILSIPATELRAIGVPEKAIRYLSDPDIKAVEKDIKWLKQPHHYLITVNDDNYPRLLRELPDRPPVLFVRGKLAQLQRPQLSIVGSRNPSHSGRQTAHEFASALIRAGFVINSGLATGIDYCAHRGALEEGGITVAVMGCGADKIYPMRHKQLANDIQARGGALVTEFATGIPPVPENFPRRNRIISGMSLGVIVIEAAQKSGSLITARHALDQGRDVFAVPGSIYNPMARGCHDLIKQGACLTESIEDILEELSGVIGPGFIKKQLPTGPHVLQAELDRDSKILLECIGHDPISMDKLINLSGLTADAVSSMLTMLEIKGLVSAEPGGLYMRKNQRLY